MINDYMISDCTKCNPQRLLWHLWHAVQAFSLCFVSLILGGNMITRRVQTVECLLFVDETQLRGKGYDKTPDYVLHVPVGKYQQMSNVFVWLESIDYSLPRSVFFVKLANSYTKLG